MFVPVDLHAKWIKFRIDHLELLRQLLVDERCYRLFIVRENNSDVTAACTTRLVDQACRICQLRHFRMTGIENTKAMINVELAQYFCVIPIFVYDFGSRSATPGGGYAARCIDQGSTRRSWHL